MIIPKTKHVLTANNSHGYLCCHKTYATYTRLSKFFTWLRITCWKESTGLHWIPVTKANETANNAERWYFFVVNLDKLFK